jgi:hypothetical protein
LRKLIAVARKYRDKYEARVRQLEGEARGKRPSRDGRSSQGAANTQLKAEVFAEVTGRFEAALARAVARPDPEAPRPRPAVRRSKRAAARATEKAAVARGEAQAERRLGRKVAVKAAKNASKRRAVSTKAHAKKAPKGAGVVRKEQAAAKRKHLAHARSRQRKQQAKRDGR